MEKAYEVNFDGIVGPTHNYAGLSKGNRASQKHGGKPSNPRAAALEGLAKMKLLMDLGVKQAVLPPHPRPHLPMLRRLGIDGKGVEEVIENAGPVLLANCYSASSMWAANCATVCPSADSEDGKVHFTPANLLSFFHRSIETEYSSRLLQEIFADPNHFVHHPPLPASPAFSDEGAANHTRLCHEFGEQGLQFFVYGKNDFNTAKSRTAKPVLLARQDGNASSAIVKTHGLKIESAMIPQSIVAINAGVFHNDVICIGHQDILIVHELAFADFKLHVELIEQLFKMQCGGKLRVVIAREDNLTLFDAVQSYIFNSQIVTLPDGSKAMIAPTECINVGPARKYIERLINKERVIQSVHYVNVRQSMANGGGPACLRLRVVLTETELSKIHHGVILNEELYNRLVNWVNKHYREKLSPIDLTDPNLAKEAAAANVEVMGILGLPVLEL